MNRHNPLHVIAVSGGMDSAALVEYMMQTYDPSEIMLVHFTSSQVFGKAQEIAAFALSDYYDLKMHVLPYRHYPSNGPTHIANHATTLLNYAAGTSVYLRAIRESLRHNNFIFYEGYHKDESDSHRSGYDSVEYLYLKDIVQNLTSDSVSIEQPFKELAKEDIVALYRLSPWGLTWSCTKNRDVQCGQCATCQARKEAFKGAGVEDLTIYVDKRE